MMLRDFRDFDDWFDGLFSGHFLSPHLKKSESELLFDIEDGDGQITLTTDVPGVKKEDIEVEFKDRALSVRGKKEVESGESRRYFLKERSSIKFDRSFQVPYEVKADEISCSLEKGILKIVLPKSEVHAPKKITIQ